MSLACAAFAYRAGHVSADRQATFWCYFGLECGQQHCGLAGGQQYGWCRQSRVAVPRPIQLLLLARVLLVTNDSFRSSGTDHPKVSLASLMLPIISNTACHLKYCLSSLLLISSNNVKCHQ